MLREDRELIVPLIGDQRENIESLVTQNLIFYEPGVWLVESLHIYSEVYALRTNDHEIEDRVIPHGECDSIPALA